MNNDRMQDWGLHLFGLTECQANQIAEVVRTEFGDSLPVEVLDPKAVNVTVCDYATVRMIVAALEISRGSEEVSDAERATLDQIYRELSDWRAFANKHGGKE